MPSRVVSSPAERPIDVSHLSLPLRGLAALAGGFIGATHTAFVVAGMNAVDLASPAAHGYDTITPRDVLLGRYFTAEPPPEGPRTPGYVKTLAWGAAGALVGLSLVAAPAAPLLAAGASALGTSAPHAVIAAGAGAGMAARAAVNVFFTGALAALYGGVRGALLMARGTAWPLQD